MQDRGERILCWTVFLGARQSLGGGEKVELAVFIEEFLGRPCRRCQLGNVDSERVEDVLACAFDKLFAGVGRLVQSAAGQNDAAIPGFGELCGGLEAERAAWLL